MRKLLFVIPLLLGAGQKAPPAITATSGTVTHGSSVIVSGSGFTSHASYNDLSDTWQGGTFLNFRFKDFEDGELKTDGFFPQRGGAPFVPAKNDLGVFDGGPRNSKKYLKRQFADDERGGLSAKSAGAGNLLYTTFKFQQAPNTQSGKLFRFYADSPQNNVYLATGCVNVSMRGFSECVGGTCSNITTEYGNNELTAGVWHRVEILADGPRNKFTITVDGRTAWSKTTWLNSTLGLNGHTIDYPNMLDSGSRVLECPASGSYDYDDIFIDFTQARIELGDAPTWSATRKREVQLPTAWSDTRITIKMNTGEFAAGQTTYLYVIDSNGTVNANGFPVTIGGGGTPVAKTPNPPTNFAIQKVVAK